MGNWNIDIENNADFYSNKNQEFYVKILKEFNFNTVLPIVFLPCASQKPISKSRTHCYLSKITRNQNLERIILSEPQSVIPYRFEQYCPNYDYPPKMLHAFDRLQMVRRVGIFLEFLYNANSNRIRIYYIGSRHHLSVLHDANSINNHFKLIYSVPAKGIRDYASAANEFLKVIEKMEEI
jgi:predicted RNA-binding protein